MKIKSAISEFIKGLKIIFSKPKEGVGDPKLAKLSNMILGQVSVYGKNAVRTQVIKSIENDLKRATKKSPEAVESMIKNALGTPEYVLLLRKLDLDEAHLRIMAMEAKKKYAK